MGAYMGCPLGAALRVAAKVKSKISNFSAQLQVVWRAQRPDSVDWL